MEPKFYLLRTYNNALGDNLVTVLLNSNSECGDFASLSYFSSLIVLVGSAKAASLNPSFLKRKVNAKTRLHGFGCLLLGL